MTKTISALTMASLLCLGGLGLTACDVPDEGPELDDSEAIGEAEQAWCVLQTPMPYDDSHTASFSNWAYVENSGSYGEGECDTFTARILSNSSNTLLWEYGMVTANNTALTDTPTECAAVTIWGRAQCKDGGVWSNEDYGEVDCSGNYLTGSCSCTVDLDPGYCQEVRITGQAYRFVGYPLAERDNIPFGILAGGDL